MKKRMLIFIIIIIMILLIPIRREANDGGTIEYSAILYKVINWNRVRIYEENKTGTEVYFFPKNFHSLDYYDDVRPNAIAFLDEQDSLVVANMGTYSWTKEVDGTSLNVIADTFGMEKREFSKILKIPEGGKIRSDGLISNIANINVYKYEGEEFELIESNLEYDEEKREINVESLNKGNYIIEVSIQEGSNQVSHSIKVQIVSKDEN